MDGLAKVFEVKYNQTLAKPYRYVLKLIWYFFRVQECRKRARKMSVCFLYWTPYNRTIFVLQEFENILSFCGYSNRIKAFESESAVRFLISGTPNRTN